MASRLNTLPKYVVSTTLENADWQPTTIIRGDIPAEVRMRVLGLLSVCIGLGPIGFLALGLTADALGATMACALTGGAGLLALALTWPLWRAILVKGEGTS